MAATKIWAEPLLAAGRQSMNPIFFFPFLLREKYGHEFLIETFNEVIAEPQKEDEPFLSSRR